MAWLGGHGYDAGGGVMANDARKRLRLVEVLVQPVIMRDDGEALVKLDHPPITIPAAEWASYSGERFPRELAEFEDQINSDDS